MDSLSVLDEAGGNQPTIPMPVEAMAPTARVFRGARNRQAPSEELEARWASLPGWREHAQLFRDLYCCDPSAADRLIRALTSMPIVGCAFLGFRLLAELGRGGLGRVFLAEQADLGRHVVVKIAPDLWGEAHTLAQLQHPHIVPIYSSHQSEPFQVVCMPYHGWTTFHDLLDFVQSKPSLPTSGSALAPAVKPAPLSALGSPASAAFTEALTKLTYEEAIVWLCTQLADGLAHAHEHGIVHHDLKPANILLTDDGKPMLLDFNASVDTKRFPAAQIAWVAGTLPYMAPEQLIALSGTPTPVDARCDLYAFGVILFEFLTGRYPFKFRHPDLNLMFEKMTEDRRSAPPVLREANAAVSPALEAIVRRCLEPDPERRYQTARELHDDLERQHAHLPLLHVAEPSHRERMHKWARRHPRALSAGIVMTFAAILLTATGALSMVRGHHLDRWQRHERDRVEQRQTRERALAAWRQFQDDRKTVQLILYTRTNEPEPLASGALLGGRLIEGYDVLENPAWQQEPLVTGLPTNDQQQLADAMAELLLLTARATLLQQEAANARDDLEKALRMNERAAACSGQTAASPGLWRQRAAIAGLLGDDAKAHACLAKAQTLPMRLAADYYWLASDRIAAGRLTEALPLLQEATQREPQNFWAWFVLAHCYDHLGMDARAEARYAVCIALMPSDPWAHFNRGLALYRQQDYRAACADFDVTIRLRPDHVDAYSNRALARQALQQYKDAEQDLTAAIERDGPSGLYFLRARVRDKLGDKAGARSDLDDGLRRPPTDEKSWIARGTYLLAHDPKAALADFEQALRINPRSADALQKKAHVLAEKLGRTRDALDTLDKLLERYPASVKARGGRGVLHARLGQRDLAIRDARESLLCDPSPIHFYQAACVYALTSKQQPNDRPLAYQFLSSALRMGYGFNRLETDSDLDAIRAQPEFRRLVEAARLLRVAPPKSKKT